MTTPEIQARLAQIRERCDKASPGPWEAEQGKPTDHYSWVRHVKTDGELSIQIQHIAGTAGRLVIADAEFVAHAREDIPWLLERIGLLELVIVADRDRTMAIEERNTALARQLAEAKQGILDQAVYLRRIVEATAQREESFAHFEDVTRQLAEAQSELGVMRLRAITAEACAKALAEARKEIEAAYGRGRLNGIVMPWL